MSIWTVELESGVWLASWEGDLGRTLVKDSAKGFASQKEAGEALTTAREYRPFARATISNDSAKQTVRP